MVIDTDSGEVSFVENPGERPLVTYAVEAAGLGAGELVAAVERAAASAPGGCIARVYLNQVDRAAFRHIAIDEFAEAVPRAIFVQVEPDAAPDSFSVQGGTEIGGLEAEWSAYVETQDLSGLERDRVAALGRGFLDDARGETV
jgi:hypothetical protein